MNSVFNDTCTKRTNTIATNINIGRYNVSIQTCNINLHLFGEEIRGARNNWQTYCKLTARNITLKGKRYRVNIKKCIAVL
jgi:hypothetical protein